MRSRAAVVGIGATSFGVFEHETAVSLASTALTRALDDAGLARADIDALIVVRVPDYQQFALAFGIDPKLAFALAGQGRMSGVAMQLAMSLIDSGAARSVAIAYGNDGRSRGMKYGGAADRYGSEDASVWFPYGMTSPGAAHAMMFARHAHLYGTDPLALAEISVAFREHAAGNPEAVMRKPISLDDHQASPFVAEPLRRFDYCLINDGGVALVLARADIARSLPRPPVYIRAVDTRTRLTGSTFPPDDAWYAPMRAVAASVYATAGIAPADVDALMVYDNFSPTVLFSLEGFGYCEQGRSGPWVREGHLRRGGRYPANTSGGHLSESYMQGFGLLAEGVRQVRKEAGARQVRDCGIVHYMCASPVCSAVIFSDSP